MTSIVPGPAGERADDDPGFRLDPLLQAVNPKIKQAITYWREKRGERVAPARAEISLHEAKQFLAHLQIFEIIDEGRAYRPRLMGTGIVRQIEEDATGKTFDDSSPRLVVHRVLRALRWVMANRKPLRTVADRTAVENHDFLSHETVFLPLSSDGKVIDMMAVVGVLSPIAD